ncbi:MAG: hypothetical protein LC794_08545 [Acidobacteria bacterium]|nr:hypothetical protein [Acidobacteriota bacterium]
MKYRTPHIFTVAAFIQGQLWVFEVSNVKLDVDWSDTALLRSFCVYGGQVTDRPLVLVRGARAAVSKADWKLLREETKQRPRRPKKFLKLLARVNKRSSEHERYGKFISRECSVSYMPANGDGVVAKGFAWGNESMPWSTVAPPRLFFGMNMTSFLREDVKRFSETLQHSQTETR